MDKLTPDYKYLDLSDYARSAARWMTRLLLPTPITPVQVTMAFVIVGIIAALLFARGEYAAGVVAGVLLIVKSGIDAVDGSLARARNRPSRVGRFADTLGDMLVNFLLFAGIAYAEIQHGAPAGSTLLLAALGFASMTWQSTVFNYFAVRYRHATGGDSTSRLNESESDSYPWDNPQLVKLFVWLYGLLLAWQDRVIAGLDRALHGGQADYRLSRGFMTAVTVMGLGTQLLVFTLCALIGQPGLAFWVFIVPMNVYWIALLLLRRRFIRD